MAAAAAAAHARARACARRPPAVASDFGENELDLMHMGVTPTAKTGGEWEEAHVSPQRDLTKLVWRFSVRVPEVTGTRAHERDWDGCWDQMEMLPASTPAEIAFKKAVKKKWSDTRYKWHTRRGSSVMPSADGAIDLRHREVKPQTLLRYARQQQLPNKVKRKLMDDHDTIGSSTDDVWTPQPEPEGDTGKWDWCPRLYDGQVVGCHVRRPISGRQGVNGVVDGALSNGALEEGYTGMYRIAWEDGSSWQCTIEVLGQYAAWWQKWCRCRRRKAHRFPRESKAGQQLVGRHVRRLLGTHGTLGVRGRIVLYQSAKVVLGYDGHIEVDKYGGPVMTKPVWYIAFADKQVVICDYDEMTFACSLCPRLSRMECDPFFDNDL
jgi:hypothetical protein